jgi:hypothetical protein
VLHWAFKSRKDEMGENVACMTELRNAQEIPVRIPQKKTYRMRDQEVWYNNSRTDDKETWRGV